MKSFNRILFLSLGILLTSVALQAQSNWVAKKAQAATDEVTAALGLNKDQTKQVYDIQVASQLKAKDIQESFKAESITQEEKKTQNRAVWKENTAQIVAALGPDLGAKYKELNGIEKKKGPKGKKHAVKAPKTEGKVAKKGKGKKGKGDWQAQKNRKTADEVAAALGLDEAQTQKIYDIQLASNLKSKELNESFKAGSITKEEQKAKSKEVRQASNAQIVEFLGADIGKQYKQFMKAQREAKK